MHRGLNDKLIKGALCGLDPMGNWDMLEFNIILLINNHIQWGLNYSSSQWNKVNSI